jgi:hypothetical protein
MNVAAGLLLNSNAVTLLEQAAVTLVTAKVIEQASGAPAQLAKAKTIATIAQDFIDLNTGKITGLASLQSSFLALVKATSNPAEALIFNALLAELGTFIAQFNSQSLLGKLGSVAADDMLGYVVTAAQAYVTSLSPPAAAAPATK